MTGTTRRRQTTMTKSTAIILVNWNSFSLSSGCILSLQEMDTDDFDIIVTDNNSADGSGRQLKERFPGITLIESSANLGFTGGNNLAIQHALELGYPYIFLLNNDTFVKKDLLRVLMQFMHDHPDAGAVQPIIYMNDNRSLIWNGGSRYNDWLGYTYVPGYGKPATEVHTKTAKVDWLSGCAFFIRSAVLKKTGPLAENMFMYYEDVDLSFRLRKQGFPVYYHPGSAVYHIAGMSNRKAERTSEGYVNPIVHYLNVRNRIWLLKQHTAWIYFPTVCLFSFFYIMALLAYFAVRLYFNKFAHVLKGIKDGLTGRIVYN